VDPVLRQNLLLPQVVTSSIVARVVQIWLWCDSITRSIGGPKTHRICKYRPMVHAYIQRRQLWEFTTGIPDSIFELLDQQFSSCHSRKCNKKLQRFSFFCSTPPFVRSDDGVRRPAESQRFAPTDSVESYASVACPSPTKDVFEIRDNRRSNF
jgi:hypothetical protein